jgi:hypothetical protein
MTRLFGKKIKGEPLKKLVSALGEDSNIILQTSKNGWSTGKAHGRVNYHPTDEGVNVDLYLFREDFHIKDGTTPEDSPILYSDVDKEEKTELYNHHIKGEVMKKQADLTIRGLTKKELKESLLEAGLKKTKFGPTFVGDGILVNYKTCVPAYPPYSKSLFINIFSDDLEKSANISNVIRQKRDKLVSEGRSNSYTYFGRTKELEEYMEAKKK